ncbi:MAG: hypothetical protein R3192_00375 [Woeseiaceae bacterium]|nr:hypothetical protein [Woeseiaceae bacterium]
MRSDVQAVLIEGMGEYSRDISSDSESAQQFFDQGLNLVWGYYFPDAAASFLEALRHDPDNPMIYWGLAMASGPNPNSRYMGAPDDPKGAAKRATAIAYDLRASASEQVQALIETLSVRYDDETYPDAAARDAAYLDAARALYQRYPQDPDVAAIYADAFMVTMPWTYWDDDGNPAPGAREVVDALEASMALHPMHPGTNHLYIHMLEASAEPERALTQADRLASIIPGGGHIVHMPTHIYVRVGQFDKAIDFNERSVDADRKYQEQWGSLPYPDFVTYPLSARLHPTHAFDFIRFSATIKGDYESAIKAAKKAEQVVLSRGPLSNGRAQRTVAAVWLVHQQFEKWHEILNGDGPPEPGHQYLDGLWNYVTGSALAGSGKLDEARAQLEQLRALANSDTPDEILVMVTPPSRILELAAHDLAGRIAMADSDYPSAIESFKAAVEIEDSLGYMEPPDWPNPVRLVLGEALLQSGEAALAEAVYRRDLSWNRNNGWSTAGLCESLEVQDKQSQAEDLCH